MKRDYLSSILIVICMIFITSCVQGDYFDELYEFQDVELSSLLKRSKQCLNDDTPWYEQPKAVYMNNECMAFSMMKMYGYDTPEQLNQIRGALYYARSGESLPDGNNLTGYSTVDYGNMIDIRYTTRTGFYASEAVAASKSLHNKYSKIYKFTLKNVSVETLISNPNKEVKFKKTIVCMKDREGHAAIAIDYKQDKDDLNWYINYEDVDGAGGDNKRVPLNLVECFIKKEE